MKRLFYYYTEDARMAAEKLAKEYDGNVEQRSYDKVCECEAMDDKAQRILDGTVSGESGAFLVYDKTGDKVAIVVYWIEKAADMMMNSLDELAEYINESEDFPCDVEDIIEANGWESITGEEFGVAIDHDKGEKAIINDDGKVEVITL